DNGCGGGRGGSNRGNQKREATRWFESVRPDRGNTFRHGSAAAAGSCGAPVDRWAWRILGGLGLHLILGSAPVTKLSNRKPARLIWNVGSVPSASGELPKQRPLGVVVGTLRVPGGPRHTECADYGSK